MSRGINQKFKLYYLAKIMLAKTDEEHYITMPEIMKELSGYEVTVERKSIYNDRKRVFTDNRNYRYAEGL